MVRYEDFVQNPIDVLSKVGDFLDVSLKEPFQLNITDENIGNGWSRFTSKQQEIVFGIIKDTLGLVDYN